MKDSIHKYFQVGVVAWMSYPGVPQEDTVFKIACDDFFDAIEVCKCPDDASRESCRSLLAQSHLKVCYGAQPRLLGPNLNPNDLSEEGRQKAQATLIEALDEAEFLGAKGVVFLSGKFKRETLETSYAQLLKTARAVCDAAKAKGMRVELEVFDYDVDKASLIGPAPLAARFAADMRSTHDNFGLVADLSHFPLTHETARSVIPALRPYITHLHFGNAVARAGCAAYGDKHPRMGFPNGENDVPELLDYLRVLRREGFFRAENPLVLSMEVSPCAGENADIVLANSKRVLNRAWALLEDEGGEAE